jgi:hypothetical protein
MNTLNSIEEDFNMAFQQCLEFGEETELEIKEILEEDGYHVEKVDGKHSFYDLRATKDGSSLAFEIKTDSQTCFTKNVAIELYKIIDDHQEPAGLSITKADYYIYKIMRDKYYYFIETETLRQLCEEYPCNKPGGDRNSVIVCLLNKEIFARYCNKVPRKTMPELSTINMYKK